MIVGILGVAFTIIFGVAGILGSIKMAKQLKKMKKESEKLGKLDDVVKGIKDVEEIIRGKDISRTKRQINSFLSSDDGFVRWLGNKVANIKGWITSSYFGSGSYSYDCFDYKLAKKIDDWKRLTKQGAKKSGFDAGDSCADFLCGFMVFCGVKGLDRKEMNDEYGDMKFPLKLTYRNGEEEELSKEDLTLKGELFWRLLTKDAK